MLQYMHLFVDPPRASAVAPVDPRLDAVLLRAMAKDPDRRPAGAHAFLAELRAAIAAGTAPASRSCIVAVVMAKVPPALLEDPPDEVLTAIDHVLCEGGAVLVAAGFAVVVEGPDRVVFRHDAETAPGVRGALDDCVRRISAGVDGRVVGALVVHASDPGGDDTPLDLARWLPHDPGPGLTITPSARAALDRLTGRG
jgi:hypothetical protein